MAVDDSNALSKIGGKLGGAEGRWGVDADRLNRPALGSPMARGGSVCLPRTAALPPGASSQAHTRSIVASLKCRISHAMLMQTTLLVVAVKVEQDYSSRDWAERGVTTPQPDATTLAVPPAASTRSLQRAQARTLWVPLGARTSEPQRRAPTKRH